MNLPNKLTLLRVFLIPPFLILLMGGEFGWFGQNIIVTDLAALLIFVIASLTDMLDGKIARKYNLITNFGKFCDPLADKLLVCSAMIALIEMGRIPAWVVIVIIAREFIISGFRLVASDAGVVIAAGWLGKIKTVAQMIMVMLMVANLGWILPWIDIVTDIVMYFAAFMTIISLIDYLWKNREVIKEK